MASKNDTITGVQTGLGVASTAGAAVSAVNPIVGGAITIGASLASGIAGLFKEPEVVEVPAGEVLAGTIQAENLARMNSINGMSQQDIQNLNQIGTSSQAEMLANVNALPNSMSLFDRQRIGDALMANINNQIRIADRKKSLLDTNADISRASAISQGTATLANIESDIQRQEVYNLNQKQATRAAMANNFAKSLETATLALNQILDLPKEPDTVPETTTPSKADKLGEGLSLLKEDDTQQIPDNSYLVNKLDRSLLEDKELDELSFYKNLFGGM